MVFDFASFIPNTDDYRQRLPAFKVFRESGLEFDSIITVFVGENGSGKSSLLEMIAESYGISTRGGHGVRRYSAPTESHTQPLSLSLDGITIPRRSTKTAAGYFHRGDTTRALTEFMAKNGVAGYENVGSLSSGQAIRYVMASKRLRSGGLFIFDEPEVSLSMSGQIEVCEHIANITKAGFQVVVATHSPVFMTLTDSVYELSDKGIVRVKRNDSAVWKEWTEFMAVR